MTSLLAWVMALAGIALCLLIAVKLVELCGHKYSVRERAEEGIFGAVIALMVSSLIPWATMRSFGLSASAFLYIPLLMSGLGFSIALLCPLFSQLWMRWEDPLVRRAYREGGPAIGSLVRDLRHWEDVYPRERAARELGHTQSRASLPALLECLGDRCIPGEVRAAAAVALGELRDESAIPALERVLERPDAECVGAAVKALAKIDHPSAFGALVRALESYDDDTVAWAAAVLGERGDPVVVPNLRAVLHESQRMRRAAVCALEKLGDCRWRQWIREDADDHQRLALAHDELATELVHRILRGGTDDDRRGLLRTIAHLPVDDASRFLPVVQECLRAADRQIQKEAIRAVGKIAGNDSVPLLLPFLRTHDEDVVGTAIEVLAEVGGEAATAQLASYFLYKSYPDPDTSDTSRLVARYLYCRMIRHSEIYEQDVLRAIFRNWGYPLRSSHHYMLCLRRRRWRRTSRTRLGYGAGCVSTACSRSRWKSFPR